MGDFFDKRLAVEGQYYHNALPNTHGAYRSGFPRQLKVRIVEAQPVRAPQCVITVDGGSGDSAGETIRYVEALHVRMGFDNDSADRVLAFAVCSASIPKADITNTPAVGSRIWVRIGVDPVNRVTVFSGSIEEMRESADGRSYEIIAFDGIRRLQEYPFEEPVTYSDVNGAYVDDYDETTLEASVQIQIAELLSAADVLTYSLAGIEQYPVMPSNRTSVYEELSALLRASQCRGYLSPSGRFMVTYTDEQPLWAVAMMSEFGVHMGAGLGSAVNAETRFHLPLVNVRAVWPDQYIANNDDFGGATGSGLNFQRYPKQYVPYDGSSKGAPWVLPMFEFTEDNVVGVERIEPTEILNEVRARTTPEADTRDFIDLSGMTFEDLETLTFSQLGDAATSSALDGSSVAEYGLRWRTYDSGTLAEIGRATKTPTGPPATTQPTVNYGRYALYRGDFAESQMRARRFPVQRIRITAPGILSLLPFEVVSVNLPREGVNGYYMVEGRRLDMGSGGFRSIDTLRRMDVPEEIVTLDARDEGAA